MPEKCNAKYAKYRTKYGSQLLQRTEQNEYIKKTLRTEWTKQITKYITEFIFLKIICTVLQRIKWTKKTRQTSEDIRKIKEYICITKKKKKKKKY